MGTIYVFLATGFEEIEAVATIDTLRRADLNVKTISITGQQDVTGVHNITVKADALFEDTDYSDACILVLPGGGPGTANLNAHEELKKLLSEFNAKERPLAAICAAPTVLAGLGILDNKKATCYPGCESQMGKAVLTGEATVTDGRIITGKGPGFAIAFGLEIVKFLKGEVACKKVAEALLIRQ
ncbi:MAG: DJ-1/PfpI family protein [Candidatus Azobacteroides sp.]|nr:DJ-1/PfpI family protein [Candidatus Azobacteroides sp.]